MTCQVLTEHQAIQIMGSKKALTQFVTQIIKLGHGSGEYLLETGAKLKVRIDLVAEKATYMVAGYAQDGSDVSKILASLGNA